MALAKDTKLLDNAVPLDEAEEIGHRQAQWTMRPSVGTWLLPARPKPAGLEVAEPAPPAPETAAAELPVCIEKPATGTPDCQPATKKKMRLRRSTGWFGCAR